MVWGGGGGGRGRGRWQGRRWQQRPDWSQQQQRRRAPAAPHLLGHRKAHKRPVVRVAAGLVLQRHRRHLGLAKGGAAARRRRLDRLLGRLRLLLLLCWLGLRRGRLLLLRRLLRLWCLLRRRLLWLRRAVAAGARCRREAGTDG
jgi:hypothetical protein